jgi:hypothetical protein
MGGRGSEGRFTAVGVRGRRSKAANNDIGGLAVSTLASGIQDRGFEPGLSLWIFGRKNPQHAFLRRGSKAVRPPLKEVFYFAWHGAPLEMTGETKAYRPRSDGVVVLQPIYLKLQIGMNRGVLWGRPRPGRGCSAIHGWMDLQILLEMMCTKRIE